MRKKEEVSQVAAKGCCVLSSTQSRPGEDAADPAAAAPGASSAPHWKAAELAAVLGRVLLVAAWSYHFSEAERGKKMGILHCSQDLL